ncbi:tubulin binding cofactor C-domain-containing protein [Panaeolus papilionaceus]|nr:tubulin binding cofactor C-domain-containing protein [Panaeolus papilionaceus]
METPTWTFSQNFTTQFQAMRSDLESRIESAKSGGSVTQETITELSILLAKATRALADATGSIPSYDQKQYELQLKGIEKSIELLRPSSSSKGKFSFKKKAAVEPSVSTAAPVVTPTPAPVNTSRTTIGSSILTLSNRENQYITRSNLPEHTQRTDLSVSDVKDCIIDLLPSPEGGDTTPSSGEQLELSALHIRNVTNCVILLPLVGGSALLHDIVNCILVLGCHQFRMHTSTRVDIFLSIGSNPIIEDCNNLRFATYPSSLTVPSLDVQETLPTVQDFSHIRPTPSPHYSILDESTNESIKTSLITLRHGGSASLERLSSILSTITPP